MKYKWVFALIIILLTIIVVYNYIYQDHRNIKTEQAEFILTPKEFLNEFSINPNKSEQKYLNKTIEVSGSVSEINKTDLTIENNVFCQFNKNINLSAKINTRIKIKGRCIGYDDLLEQVKLDQCYIIN
ncbi:hypothetical protein [uncultured Wocania sp.]|uniref:OB-fold protein n=1 Tax=uncultured Wocania sp. TaxID=2834404 RepID=UPI0030FBEB17